MQELPQVLKEVGEAEARVVMLSSAGVTRTKWDAKKAETLVGAADIPIIRLNPGGSSAQQKWPRSQHPTRPPACLGLPPGPESRHPRGCQRTGATAAGLQCLTRVV